MNGILLLDQSKDSAKRSRFCDSLTVKYSANGKIIAQRSPKPDYGYDSRKTDIELMSESRHYAIYRDGDKIICRLNTSPAIEAVITPEQEAYYYDATVKMIRESAGMLYAVNPYSGNILDIYSSIEEIVSGTADYCGCLTDISRNEDEMPIRFERAEEPTDPDSSLIGAVLVIISLMFRRISALRGFNFRFTLPDGLPCLVFSADVILEEGETSIDNLPEYNALKSFSFSGEPIIVSRLGEPRGICESRDPENMHRLFLAICPQNQDPRGILRAGEWLKRAKNVIETIDLDIPGRF